MVGKLRLANRMQLFDSLDAALSRNVFLKILFILFDEFAYHYSRREKYLLRVLTIRYAIKLLHEEEFEQYVVWKNI